MWDTYKDLAELRFENAKIAVDSFHVIKHLNEAMFSIRIKFMNKYNKKHHHYYLMMCITI